MSFVLFYLKSISIRVRLVEMTKYSPTYIQSNVYRTELFCLEVKCAQQMFTKMILLVELDRY